MQHETTIAVVGAIIAVVLQVVLAPNIAIFSAMPNFLVVYTLVLSMLMEGDSFIVFAFVLGMTSDLLGYGPVGSMAFLLIIASFAASRAFAVFGNGTVFVPLAVLMILSMLAEIFYAVFVVTSGMTSGVIDAFLYRAFPCALYDCVVGLLIYPIMSHFLVTEQATMGSATPTAHLR